MVWATQQKRLLVSQPIAPHSAPFSRPFPTKGKVPKTTSVTLTPAGLFGATARCSCLRPLDPLAVTPESQMIRALVEQHVDDVSSDFFLLGSVSSFKDFVRSHFAGTVAAGLTYLFMIGEGYVWADHFELQSPRGDPTVRSGPDFVFTGPGMADVALVESKGTTSGTQSDIDKRTESGYAQQIEPHLGYLVGGAIATHGFAVGAWMTPPPSSAPSTAATLVLHHTTPRRLLTGADRTVTGTLFTEATSVIAGNYATACELVFGPGRGQAIRDGRPFDIDYAVVEWLGERWIVPRTADDSAPPNSFGSRTVSDQWLFALHHETAMEVFERAASDAIATKWSDFAPNSMIENIAEGALNRGSQIFPDGLAVIARTEFFEPVGSPLRWLSESLPASDVNHIAAEAPAANTSWSERDERSTTNQMRGLATGEFES